MRFPAFMLVVLCGALWLAADSHAFTPASSPYIERYERVATRYWADVPDCERVEYLWPAEDPFGGEGVTAYAETPGCRMWLVYWEPLKGKAYERATAYEYNCATLTHEWGHLLGFDHGAEKYLSGDLYDACFKAAQARYKNAAPMKAAKPKPKPHRKPIVRHGAQATWTPDFDDSGLAREHGEVPMT